MKFNNILASLALGSLLVGFTACMDEVQYNAPEPSPLTDYYFPTTNSASQELVDGQTSFTVTVARAESKGAATVNISSSCTPDNPFTVPSSVTFADGEGVTSFNVTFDLANVTVNQHYTMTLSIPGIENTPYSYGSFDIDILYLPWRDFKDANGNILKGIYREGLAQLYDGGVTQYEVTIQQHPTIDGIYRIVNPYGPEWPYYDSFAHEAGDHYMVIDATNPNQVLIDNFNTGIIDNADGLLYYSSFAAYALAAGNSAAAIAKNGYFAFLNKGIIKFDADLCSAINQAMVVTFQSGEGPFIGNRNNPFKIVLPGYEDEAEWEEVGMCDYTDGFVSPFMGLKDNKYKVLVEKSLLTEGVYRLVNPWGPNSGLTDEAAPEDTYVEIDVNDPEFVLFGEIETGFYANQTTELFVTSAAEFLINYQEQSADDVKALGFGGKFKDNVITLPGNQVIGMFVNMTTGQFNAGSANDEFLTNVVIDLNSATPSAANKTQAKAAITGKKVNAQRINRKLVYDGKADGAISFIK